MSLINITNLTFSYEGSSENIFENTSFSIDTDWKVGFTGRNGKGKTTLLNLLLGKYDYKGVISSNVNFEYFPYEVTDHNNLTIDIMQEIVPYAQKWEIVRETSKLEINDDVLYQPFCTLSNGEQTKTLLAAMFLKENNFLLIDEPTNHIDEKSRKILGKYLNQKDGFILVSHDRCFLDSCIDHILAINRQEIEICQGNFSSWYYNKELRDNFELAENKKLIRDISRLSDSEAQSAHWSHAVEKSKYNNKNSGSKVDRGFVGHKSAKMMKRSKSIENRKTKLIDKKSELLKNIETSAPLKLSCLDFYSDIFAEFKDVSIKYDERTICSGITFKIERGDKIALRGPNGCGKSSLLKIILGENVPYSGFVDVNKQLKISYVPQNFSGLCGSLKNYAEKLKIDESLFKSILRKFGFERELFDREIDNYSEGQKKKVFLAGSLCEKAHIYVWDEPLNYIDVISRLQIEKMLSEYNPTIIFVEHDSMFCSNIATKNIVISTDNA